MDNAKSSCASSLALPAPNNDTEAPKVILPSDNIAALKFDTLGPMVVNSDGVSSLRDIQSLLVAKTNQHLHQTLSRIMNWDKMTELEIERTMRVLNARNR